MRDRCARSCSPEGIRTPDLFLERELLQRRDLREPATANHSGRDKNPRAGRTKPRGREAPHGLGLGRKFGRCSGFLVATLYGVQVTLAAEEGGRIVFDVSGREHGTDDYWDGNWLSCRVSVRAGRFSGTFGASLRSEEFERMRDGVRVCVTDLKGTFVFETMEEQLSIVAKGDGLGHFTAECAARDAAGWGNLLTFTLALDQTYLPPLAAELDALLRAYPVVGKRP